MQNKQAISLLFLANTISGFSQGISMIAIPWYFTAILGLQSEFGLFYGILTLVSTVWSIYAGTLIDRYNRKKILLIQSIFGFIFLAIAAWVGSQDIMPLWLISGFVFTFTILLYNIHYMNIYSFAQEITPISYYPKVISYLEIQGQSTTILGGAAAAVLLEGTSSGNINIFGFNFELGTSIRPWKLHQIFALDSLTYFIAIFILLAIRYIPVQHRTIDRDSVWKRLRVGWDYIIDKPALMIFGWLTPAVFICVLLISFFLMPSYVSNFLHSKSNVFASSEFYFALGALFAGVGARFFLKSKHEVTRILILFALAAIVFLIFIFNTHLGLFYVANILFGFSNASIRFNRVSYVWKIVPNQLAGRVSSVINISSYVLRAFWGFIFALPWFTGEAGIQRVMIILFIFILVCAIIIGYYQDEIKKLEVKS